MAKQELVKKIKSNKNIVSIGTVFGGIVIGGIGVGIGVGIQHGVDKGHYTNKISLININVKDLETKNKTQLGRIGVMETLINNKEVELKKLNEKIVTTVEENNVMKKHIDNKNNKIYELNLTKQEFNNIKKRVSVINVDDYKTYKELRVGLKTKYGRLAGVVYTDLAKDIYGNKDETLNNNTDNHLALQKHYDIEDREELV